MITYFATIDRRNVISRDIFALTSPLQKNRSVFEYNTRGNAFIIHEQIYDKVLCEKIIEGHTNVVISEKLFKEHQKPGDRLIEQGDLVIVAGFQTALAYASSGRKDVTILGDDKLLHEITNFRGNDIDRILLVRVDGVFNGNIYFPEPILEHYFVAAYQDPWPVDDNNPYECLLQVYWRK